MKIPQPEIDVSRVGLRQLDPRTRVLASVGFALLVAVSEKWSTVGISLGCAAGLMLAAGMMRWQTWRRLLELNTFILCFFVFLPPSIPGTPVFSIGSVSWSLEGILRSALISLKANSIMIAFAVLVATLEPIALGLALERLGLPHKLTTMFFFTVRYLEVIHDEYLQLRTAMKLRGFRPGFTRHTFKSYGYLVGMLIVKSLDRSERIFIAMKCRGFRNRFYSLSTLTMTSGDGVFGGVWCVLLAFLGWCEWGMW